MNNEISKYNGTIDYNDLMGQIEDLQDERIPYAEADDTDSLRDIDRDLEPLVAFAKEVEDAGDAKDCTFINLAYLPKYLEEQFFSNTPDNQVTFEVQYIDWNRVAKDVKCDYSMVEFDDCTFLYLPN